MTDQTEGADLVAEGEGQAEGTERIEGAVAQILNARELVINKGQRDGVGVGMRFAILNRHGASIKDPETGEDLGSVELAKTLVKVVRVQEKLAVCRTFRIFRTEAGPLYYALGRNLTQGLASPPSSRVETLRTDEKTLQQELDESESFVKVGDPAIQMVGDEFADQKAAP